jgi:hypothetical protein
MTAILRFARSAVLTRSSVLFLAQKGEWKAQACARAWFRQLRFSLVVYYRHHAGFFHFLET